MIKLLFSLVCDLLTYVIFENTANWLHSTKVIHPVQAPTKITYSHIFSHQAHVRLLDRRFLTSSDSSIICREREREIVHRRCVHSFFPKREITPICQPEQTYTDVCQRCPSHVDTMSILAFESDGRWVQCWFSGLEAKACQDTTKQIKNQISWYPDTCFNSKKWHSRCWIWICGTWIQFHFVPRWCFIHRTGATRYLINLFSLNWWIDKW